MIHSTNDARLMEYRWLRRLADETSRVRATAEYRAWLEATLHQWRYSPFNCALIFSQRPGARHVASEAEWNRRGRPLKSGVRPIWILAPTSARRFVGVRVFSAEDTIGPPVEAPEWTLLGRTKHLPALEEAAARLRVTIEAGPLPHGAVGVALEGRRIRLRRDVSEAEQAVTLIHELAHILLGHVDAKCVLTRAQRESEAEGVSWVVAMRLSMQSRAPEYLAGMGSMDHLLAATRRIGAAARSILKALEPTKARRQVPSPKSDEVSR
jgi:hypothetical protein